MNAELREGIRAHRRHLLAALAFAREVAQHEANEEDKDDDGIPPMRNCFGRVAKRADSLGSLAGECRMDVDALLQNYDDEVVPEAQLGSGGGGRTQPAGSSAARFGVGVSGSTRPAGSSTSAEQHHQDDEMPPDRLCFGRVDKRADSLGSLAPDHQMDVLLQ